MAKLSTKPTWAAMLAVGSLGACDGDSAGSGGGSQAGTASGPSGPVSVGNGPSGPGVTATSVTTAATGSGGSSFDCDPPAAPGSLYELFADSWDPGVIEPVSMCQFRGDVLLIANVAAE